MRYIILVFLSTLFLSHNVSETEASETNVSKQELYFYSDTTIPQADDTKLSLCYLTTTHSKFGINFWRTMDDYVLSANKCVGYTYLKITPAQFAQAKNSEMIPNNTPIEPAMSWKMFFGGFYGTLLAAFLVFAVIFTFIYRKKSN